ncbi:MAG: helix-turn-helix transcriptional regulator [Clostridia bacterium]|nr:helix-turn-helix transcriptional regulator [Clostridia bacterium]
MNERHETVEYKDREFYFLYNERSKAQFTESKRWQEHSFCEIMYLEEGEIEYAVESKRHVIKKGDVLLVSAGSYHLEKRIIKSPTKLYCLGFFPDNIGCHDLACEIFERGRQFSLGKSSAFVMLLSAAREKLSQSKSCAHEFIRAMSEAAVFILSDLDMSEDPGEDIKNVTVRRVIDYINKNLSEIRSCEDIAAAMFFSPSYVRSIFKREMGIGIMEYVRNKRILLAHRKMKHGKKPTEIYAECGFSNYPSFYRAYLDYFGYSPKMVKKL